jgi:hypothetical protein
MMRSISRRVASFQIIRSCPFLTASTIFADALLGLNPAPTKTLVSKTTAVEAWDRSFINESSSGDPSIRILPHGAQNFYRPDPARTFLVEGLLARLPLISFDTVTARIHARLSAEIASNGTAVGPHDLIIAATALTKGYIVITRDECSFPENSRVVVSTLVTVFFVKATFLLVPRPAPRTKRASEPEHRPYLR